MGRKSSIDLLPQEVIDAIEKCLKADMTLDDIVDEITKMGEKVSRSALGRKKIQLDEMLEHVNHSRIMAEALVDNLGEASESKIARANIELLHSALFKLNHNSDEGLDAKEVYALSKATEALAKAKKIDQDTIIEVERVTKEKAAAVAGKIAKKAGLTAETVEDIRQGILGIKAAK